MTLIEFDLNTKINMVIQNHSTTEHDMSRRASLNLLRKVFPNSEIYYTRTGHAKPQERCLEANPDAKLYMVYQNSEKDRMYMAFPTAEAFVVPYMKNLAFTPEARFFELLTDTCNPKMNFDMDYSLDDHEKITEKEALALALELFEKMSSEYLKHELDLSLFRITTATKDNKISIHTTYASEMRFKSSAHHNVFVKTYSEQMKALGLDLGIYHKNRCMRVLGSTKFGEERYLFAKARNGKKLNRKKINLAEYLISAYAATPTYFEVPDPLEHIERAKPRSKSAKANLGANLPDDVKFAIELFKQCADSKSQDTENIKSWEQNPDGSYFVNFYRATSGYCSICDRTHDNDNCVGLLVDPPNNKIFHRCNRSKEHVKEHKTLRSDKQQHVRFLGHLRNLVGEQDVEAEELESSEEDTSFTAKTLKKALSVDLVKMEDKMTEDFEKIGAVVHKYDMHFCGHNMDAFLGSTATIVAHKADMGLGKTVAVAKLLAAEATANPESRGISLTNRQSLSKQMNRTLADGGVPGAVCYLDFKKETKETKETKDPWKLDEPEYRYMGISPESLFKMQLAKNKRKYLLETLLIDEVDAAMQQFTGDTFKNRPGSSVSWKKFELYVQGAKRIIIMDANLTAEHVEWLQKIRGRLHETVDVFWNQRQNLKDRELKITSSFYDVVMQAGKDLEANRKIMVAANIGTDSLRAIRDTLQLHVEQDNVGQRQKVLLICRETLHEADVKEALADPKGTWHKYAGIVYSPSMESGVSYDVPDVIHRVYAIFSNFTSIANSAAQMLNRCRHPIDKTVLCSVVQRNNNIGPLSQDGIFKHLQANQEHLDSVRKEVAKLTENAGIDYDMNEQNIRVMKKNSYMKLYLRNEAVRNESLTFFLYQFMMIHRLSGYKVSKYEHGMDPESYEATVKKYKKLIKLMRTVNDFDQAEVIAKSINIDEAKAKALSKKIENNEATQEELHQIKKFNTLDTYSLEADALPTTEGIKTYWFLKYGQPQTKAHYRAQNRVFGHKNFGEALDRLKAKEQDAERKRLIGLTEREDLVDADLTLRGVMTQTTRKPKYQRYKLLLGWLAKFGVTELNSARELSPAKMSKTLLAIHAEIVKKPKRVQSVLNKQKRAIKHITELVPEDDKFRQRILEFVNGSLSKEFGVRMGKRSKHDDTYILHNSYLDLKDDMPRFDVDRSDEAWVPKLGQSSEVADAEDDGDETSDGEDLGF
jgi:hypothetical protein